jgi:hypothetical protein
MSISTTSVSDKSKTNSNPSKKGFLIKLALGNTLLYILLLSTAIYLKGHLSTSDNLSDWIRYFDFRVSFLALTGTKLSFADTYLFNFSLFVAIISGLFGLYYLAYRYCVKTKVSVRLLFGLTAGIGLALALQPYLFSSDVFSYTIYGRIVAVYHQNPFKVPVETFSQDPVYKHLSWGYGFTIYGPVWTLWSAGIGMLWSDNVALQVLFYRLVALAFHLLTGLMVWKISGRYLQVEAKQGEKGETRTSSLVLYLWNPLLLIEVSSAHNDFYMLFFVMLGLWWFSLRPKLTGLMAVMFGALSKVLAAPYLPSFLILQTRLQSGWKRKIITFVAASLVLVGMLALFYLPFETDRFNTSPPPQAIASLGGFDSTFLNDEPKPPEKSAFDNLFNFINGQTLYLNSPARALHSALSKWLIPVSGSEDKAEGLANLIVRNGLRLIFLGLLLWEFKLTRNWSDLRASLLRISFYSVFLLYTWFWPWYLIPLIAFATVNRWGIWSKGAILFSFTVSLEYAFTPINDMKETSLYTLYQWRTLLTFGIPLCYIVWGLWQQRKINLLPNLKAQEEPAH